LRPRAAGRRQVGLPRLSAAASASAAAGISCSRCAALPPTSCRRQERGRGNTKQGRGGGGRHPTDRLTAASTKKIEWDVPVFAHGSAPASIRREHLLQHRHSAPHACPTIYSSKVGSFEINISISLSAENGDAMLLHVVSRTNG
jgi:hypothetical protein